MSHTPSAVLDRFPEVDLQGIHPSTTIAEANGYNTPGFNTPDMYMPQAGASLDPIVGNPARFLQETRLTAEDFASTLPLGVGKTALDGVYLAHNYHPYSWSGHGLTKMPFYGGRVVSPVVRHAQPGLRAALHVISGTPGRHRAAKR